MTLPLSRKRNNRDPQPEPDVETVQVALIERGFGCGPSGVDGRLGADTERAINTFRSRLGLPRNGVVDAPLYRELVDRDVPRPASAAWVADHAFDLVTGRGRPEYVLGAEVDLHDPKPRRLDCSELVQWAVFQGNGRSWVDGSRYQAAACRLISVRRAIETKGALLFISDTGRPGGVHHVAFSMGDGTTAEARNTSKGCGSWSAHRRGWNLAGLIPVLRY